VLTRWQGWLAAGAVTLVTALLVVADLTDNRMRLWWLRHALTTDTVAGLLVLLITVLVVDQVVRIRQVKDRSLAIAAQAAIMMAQAGRATSAVSSVVSAAADPGGADAGGAGREGALDEVRTFLVMLLVGAPVLIDGRVSRAFLEQAQSLGGELARALSSSRAPGSSPGPGSAGRLDDAVTRLRAAAAPLLRPLSFDERIAAAGITGD